MYISTHCDGDDDHHQALANQTRRIERWDEPRIYKSPVSLQTNSLLLSSTTNFRVFEGLKRHLLRSMGLKRGWLQPMELKRQLRRFMGLKRRWSQLMGLKRHSKEVYGTEKMELMGLMGLKKSEGWTCGWFAGGGVCCLD